MRPFLWIATIVAVLCVLPAVNPAPVHADPPLVYPGMLIYQGSLSCTLGYVDPALRVGITAGHCFNGDGIIRNGDGAAVGHKVLAHDNRPPEGPVYENEYTIDYEAISIDDGLPVNDVLANGQRLERDDTVIPDVGMPVCRTGFTTGDACGSVTRIGNGWFRFNGPVIAKGDSGGPVYTHVGDRTVLVGIIRGFMTSQSGDDVQSWAMSWPSVIKQLREDRKGLLPA
ncbi:Uncharacterised protein [Mycobacteroides abscessus subsp. bolletii]|uniref:Serine protease n=2 Tax=Mycobacteroides abscessus TaxID=36809 RepID=A0A829PYI0_9MYCO|nr:hypothetical protein [Mycobacteroides abscessus]ETZ93665.1 hypothetical protein L828_1125 [Mycobacteroides abscessus MAB_030201_1061]EUA45214.1 hypothetical protein I543_3589 [Mycobacteroides abscessus 21]AMU22105.1 hypothetical protein A3N95_15820 [Mycobacteroides abscessus]AMU56621.1 hypothetical protein A3O02_16725 [Mycobacteroides abscessus]AMU71301.1 hypothetical protein A3O05_15590 [Mycobacteroides abscessus]